MAKGVNHLKLCSEPLDVAKISGLATSESSEAISMFVRTTRDPLEYEAYEKMALKQLAIICQELRRQWPDLTNIVIFHRLGLVGIGEPNLMIAISSTNHENSLSAVGFVLDNLKERLPIWKKVTFSDKTKLFNENICPVADPSSQPNQLIQISVAEEEIQRRIQCFVEKKRNEIDLCNIMDYTDFKQKDYMAETLEETENNNEDADTMTCARVNSTVVKQEYSKCHLKVSQVKNTTGPQTRPNYLNALDKLMVPIKEENEEFLTENRAKRFHSQEYNSFKDSAIVERLENIEEHLCLPQNQIRNIHERLKVIEDRLIFLESVSPEYGHFLVANGFLKNTTTRDIKSNEILQHDRKIYTANDIDMIVQKFEENHTDHQDDTIT